jgi:hypothetical protein
MTSAWVAVIISVVTVVVNFFGVYKAGALQTRLAHEQRVGDRRIDTYLELLEWADGVQEKLRDAQGALGAWEAVEMPYQLHLRANAFASDDVIDEVKAFVRARLALNKAAIEREDAIKKAVAQHLRSGDSLSGVLQVVPEFDGAVTAHKQLRSAVRKELKPKD